MTLGDWLNRVIMEDTAEADAAAQSAAEAGARPAASPSVASPPFVADEFQRLGQALDRLSTRVDSAEHRSTLAISGIDQTVLGLLSRLELGERDQVAVAARFEGALDDIRAEQARSSERMTRVEEIASQPRSVEALRALETALGKVAAHLYDSETRTRETLSELRSELGDVVQTVARLQEADAPPPQAMIDGVVSRIVQRLEEAEARTSSAIRGLESSVAEFDHRLKSAESRNEGPEQRLEHLAAELNRNFETARTELAQRVEQAADTRLAAVERSMRAMAGQVQASERRSTQAMERMGGEVLRVAEALGKRMEGVETRSAEAIQQVGGDVARIADVMEGRLRKADQVQAESLERLGSEIARITERLAERIANAERRSAQAIDDVGEQVARNTERLNQRHERTAGDLADRIRQSEERTARLLEEAREKIDQRLAGTEKRLVEQVASQPPPPRQREYEPDLSSLFADTDLPPGPFGQEAQASVNYARRGGGPAGFVPPIESLPPEPERSPFEGDDFDAAEMFEAFEEEATAPPAEAEAEVADIAGIVDEEPASGLMDDPFEDLAPEPEPADAAARPSTRDLIAQARAAARAAHEGGGESAQKKPLFSGFGLTGKKPKKTGKLKTGVMIAAGAAALGVSTAGLTLYSAQWVEAARGGMTGGPGKAPAGPGAAPAVLPQAAVALVPEMTRMPAPAIAGGLPEAGPDLSALYSDAVRRIEAKDLSGVADLRKAANLGHAASQFYLAKLYETGDAGVPKNIGEARRWTERAAENGDRKAMHNLGLYYFEGNGGPKNLTMAAQWFRRAADLGLVDSQYNLARLYEGGFGVAKNPAEAYKWYLVAGRSGDGESRVSSERVKRELSADSQRIAERAASAFRADTPMAPVQLAAAPGAPSLALAQRALSKLGYYKGPADGVASPALKLAIGAYQRDQGLAQTGAVDSVLTDRLAKISG